MPPMNRSAFLLAFLLAADHILKRKAMKGL
jgi:hypothetical protein